MSNSNSKLGIIAGGGELPVEIARSCLASDRPIYVMAVDEFAGEIPSEIEHTRMSMGKLGGCIRTLKAQKCADLVFVGTFARPKERKMRLRPDLSGILFLVRNFGVLRRSNDGIHRAIASTFERSGFRVLSPLSAAPNLAADEGYISSARASKEIAGQFTNAIFAARAHGASRKGQAIIFCNGETIATEDRAGTDAMLRALPALNGRRAILVKAMSPGQLPTMDPPAIGSKTVEIAAAVGLVGILVEAGKSILVQPDRVREIANKNNLFVCGWRVEA